MFTDAWQTCQALLDMSALWPRWYRMETNIIIHILYPSYQEMLMSLRAGGGGVEAEGNGLESPVAIASVAVAVCLFVCFGLILLAFP